VRCYEQAQKFLPNSSLIRQSLAFVARDRGQWEQSESYFNEAERLDPRNANLLTRHAQFYIALRRFPEAVGKLDLILEIVPNDIDDLVEKGAIAQAEGDLPRAAGPSSDRAHAGEKDVNNGSRVLQYFAITAAWAGEKELALQQLEAGLRAPHASQMLSYGALKLLPFWDPLPRRSALRAHC
jgi:tetratricopeptide (TPR) repeat protein